jgi:hypothetical protein
MPLHPTAVQRAVKAAVRRAGLSKPASSALYYRNGRQLITVPVSLRPSLSWGAPRVLFETDAMEFDVAPDGKRFLLLVSNPEANHSEIHIVLNWFQELKQRERAAAR